MTVESLMVHEVSVGTQSGETQSSSGEVTPLYTWTDTTMLLQPRNGEEVAADRNTPIGNWRGFGRADFVWDSTQRIAWEAHTFDIVAPPEPHWNARLDVLSHYELDLQEVDTVESVDAIATPNVVGGTGGV